MLLSENNNLIFRYDPKDYHLSIKENEEESAFDRALREKWQEAENNGILRYKLNIKRSRVLEGQHQFFMQLNLDRASNRRPPEHMSSMMQPFDPDRFNFTKLRPEEILFDLENGDGNNVLAVNVSPIEQGHCLILTDRLLCLPQNITKHSLYKSIEILLLSTSPYLRVFFNSLCAHASVNHLHWHTYYLKHKMLLEHIHLQHAVGPLFFLMDFPGKGFCIKKSCTRGIDSLVSWTFLIINYLQWNQVAHNVYITRAKSVLSNENYDDIRVYVWARMPSYEVKDVRSFYPAVCELFGHLSPATEQAYNDLTEERVSDILGGITNDVFLSVKEDLLQLVNEELDRQSKLDNCIRN